MFADLTIECLQIWQSYEDTSKKHFPVQEFKLKLLACKRTFCVNCYIRLSYAVFIHGSWLLLMYVFSILCCTSILCYLVSSAVVNGGKLLLFHYENWKWLFWYYLRSFEVPGGLKRRDMGCRDPPENQSNPQVIR